MDQELIDDTIEKFEYMIVNYDNPSRDLCIYE